MPHPAAGLTTKVTVNLSGDPVGFDFSAPRHILWGHGDCHRLPAGMGIRRIIVKVDISLGNLNLIFFFLPLIF
jgi:hypothetical protein